MTSWPHQSECNSFYGNPSINNASWQSANLTRVEVPWQMYMAEMPIKRITIHVKCAASLKDVLAEAWANIGKSQFEAHKRGWDVYSGSYNYRPIRGSKRLSMHAYGCAIDFNAPCNQLHSDPTDNIGFTGDDPLVRAFERHDWIWGGRWKGRSDPMHFQAAIV